MLSLWKPWYVCRPSQVFRRAYRALTGTPNGPVAIQTPWRMSLEIDPRETIGRALWTTAIYDLSASETLFRLARPGGLHLDVGANIGYMTALLSFRAGSSGRVLAFEPHPVVGERLARNVERMARHSDAAPVELHRVALSDTDGSGRLVNPDRFEQNTGLARLSASDEAGGVSVLVRRVDDVLGDRTAVVTKIDVEGHEAAVLRGANRALAEKRLRHVLFEEHGGPEAESFRLLAAAGYALFQVGWRMAGPVLADLNGPSVCKPYEAPNFLATLEPDAVRAALARRGWDVLRGRNQS